MQEVTIREKIFQKSGKLKSEFKDEKGERWYLIPCETNFWENGTPHIVFYRTVWENRILIRLNEIGEILIAKYV